MQGFQRYANDVLTVKHMPEALMLNGHTCFLVANKKDNMMQRRMNWIVNNYTTYENIDKRPYYEYYKRNVNDEFVNIRDYEMLEGEQQMLEFEDDVDIHYRELNNKYAALAKFNDKLQKSGEEISEITEPVEFEESIAETSEYQSTLDYDDDYYNDMCINDDYYDKCLENELYEDDDFDY